MTRRSGATLLEILVAIFVCAIGLISLMALFPLGASIMAQADRSSRVSYVASGGLAVGQAMGIGHRADPTDNRFETYYLSIDPTTYFTPAVQVTRADTPSLPVFVDPYGADVLNYSSLFNAAFTVNGSTPLTMAGLANGIPRSRASFSSYHYDLNANNQVVTTTDTSRLRRWFTLQDTMRFTGNGDPVQLNLTLGVDNDPIAIDRKLQRDSRLSWGYMLRRPNRGLAALVEMSIVVYERRVSFPMSQEAYYQSVLFNTTSNLVQVVPGPGQARPNIKAGGYILDATLIKDPQIAVANGGRIFEPHGFYYQVVNVTDDPSSLNGVVLELSSKPRMNSYSIINNQIVPYGVLIVQDGVIEVLDRGPIR